tara:strand:- start:5160 stop:5738 length:579 start_codon:yes stop_codon:yes gene_type:complete
MVANFFRDKYKPEMYVDELSNTSKNYDDNLKNYTGSIVLKNHYTQLIYLNTEDKDIIKWILTDDWYNVRLLRRNFVEQSLSLAISNYIENWDTHEVKGRFTLEKKYVTRACREIWENWVDQAENELNIKFNRTIYYEDFINSNIYRPTTLIKNRKKDHILDNLDSCIEIVQDYLNIVSHELIKKDGNELSLK